MSKKDRQLVILRVAALSGSAYERMQHLPIARRAGWSYEQIAAIEAGDQITLGEHASAIRHVPGRAIPFRFHLNRGERAITIDEVPLQWCYQPDVKLDFGHLPDGYVATPSDVEAKLARIGTRCSRWKSCSSTPAPAPSTASELRAERLRHRAVGDALSAGAQCAGDRHGRLERGCPVCLHARRYAETHDAGLIWEGHKTGLEIGYCHLEKLHIWTLPPTDFSVPCFPVKIRAASAGWTRAVAIVNGTQGGAVSSGQPRLLRIGQLTMLHAHLPKPDKPEPRAMGRGRRSPAAEPCTAV